MSDYGKQWERIRKLREQIKAAYPAVSTASLDEARAIQEAIARAAEAAPPVSMDGMRVIAGADASYSPDGRVVHAAVAALGLPDLNVVERCWVSLEVPFPYVPGFFAFREGPAIISAVLRPRPRTRFPSPVDRFITLMLKPPRSGNRRPIGRRAGHRRQPSPWPLSRP